MASQDLATRIFTVSNLKGAFRLRSGAIADEYFDKYLFESDPQLLKEIAAALRPLIPPGIDALAGLELGVFLALFRMNELKKAAARL